MQAGKLRHRLTIQQDSGTTQDASGQTTSNWTEYKTVWADIQPVSGLERNRANQMQAETSHLISIRYLDGVTTKMRGLFQSDRYFEFLSVLNVGERNIELQIQAKERV
jgi:SPP1 family predicted phage head-tail adaptor